ncbi:angiopoietin-related protein 5-like [Centropristis striata]|uniref:angiopoietin-related protein 5-like n=1 Tax=Centropristis striata TaxID=184440 RepID=UPI0027E0C272|nr:angiopoietin-related protein 5-like [Centropristis striata]XP_059182105.1 angiopoietin-related protein 5-like [Centropristis striata]
MKIPVGYCMFILAFLVSCTEQAMTKPSRLSSQGTDCTQIKALSPQASSGVYVIQPSKSKAPFKVFCEMRTDGGWTVFQRRSGGALSFNRKWTAYKKGFGNLTHDHWLGLKKVFSLTKNRTKKWTMRVDLWDHDSSTSFAEYRHFRLGNAKNAFKLHVGKYNGNAGDAIRGAYTGINQNGFGFSTIDNDNDGCNPECIFGDIAERECASADGGGWWYSRCGSASLNGDWHPAGDNIGWASGLHWHTWKTVPYSMKATRMMIKSV